MQILLFSMPDSFEHTPSLTMRMPNGALASIAGNLDPHHQVGIADLVLAQQTVPETVARLVQEREPDIVGLSVMTFQRKTARRVIALVRSLRPGAIIVVGGYDPSLAPDVYEDPSFGVDIVVRGEGDLTMRELVRALETGASLESVPGISYRRGASFVRTPDRHVSNLGDDVRPPNRGARLLSGYTFLGRQIDVMETSRGCTYDCSFCSIIEMRGRNFHVWPIERVIGDIRDARARGARALFMVDDNITLNVVRFKELCEAIIEAGLTDIDYIIQGMTSAIASAGDELAALMRRAGFRYVFLGIENVVDQDLAFLRAAAKNADAAERQDRRQRDDARYRRAPPARHVRCRRPHRRESGRHARIDFSESGIREAPRRLALHPASDAISGHADDRRLPGARSHRQRKRRRI